MDISGLEYIADQIIGHLKVFQPGNTLTHEKANYPSERQKPCDIHIWNVANHNQFHISGRLEAGKDIRICIRCEPVKNKAVLKTRRKRYREVRDYLASEDLHYKNLIIVDRRLTRRSKYYQDLCMQLGIYLARDGIIDKYRVYIFLENFIKQYYSKQWKETGNISIDIFTKNLLGNYKIPPKYTAFRSFLGLTLKKDIFIAESGRMKIAETKEGNKSDSFDYVLDSKQANRYNPSDYEKALSNSGNYFDDFSNNAGQWEGRFKHAPNSTVYEWIKSGKILGVKGKGRLREYPKDFGSQLRKLATRVKEKKRLSELAEYATPEGKNARSTQRKFQRWRKNGLSLQEIAEKVGITNPYG